MTINKQNQLLSYSEDLSTPLAGQNPKGLQRPSYKRNVSRRAMRQLSELLPERPKHTLQCVIEGGTSHLRGGHLRWKHTTRRVMIDGKHVLIQRAVYEQANGPIPDGFFLLNGCQVEGCIAAECHYATRYSNWHDVFTHHESFCTEDTPTCNGQPPYGGSCVG